MKRNILLPFLWLFGCLFAWSQTHVYEMSDFGIIPGKRQTFPENGKSPPENPGTKLRER